MMKPTRPFKSKGSPYPAEFREEAVRYWLSSGQSLKNVAADLGVSPECLRSWHRQMEGQDSAPVSGVTNTSNTPASTQPSSATELAQAREIGQLRRELEAMTRQRDILKKAISIFSDDKSLSGTSSNGANSGGLK
jgi:transposase